VLAITSGAEKKELVIIKLLVCKIELIRSPHESSVQTVIDTFVGFVVKNGPSFEEITKEVLFLVS
jgi:hypothetical protein